MRLPHVMCGLVLALAGAGFAAAQTAAPTDLTPQEVLARMPRSALLRLPTWLVQQALAGEIPAADLMAAAGLAHPAQATGMTVAQQKQYITHWISHDTAIVEGLNEDTVGLASIDGRCSGQAIGDGSKAPYGCARYYSNDDGTVDTS